MAYGAKILADSISPEGIRLTTFQVTYPRFVHAELMTHRVFSRNSASSRAIPVHKMHKAIKEDPVLPVWWGKNQSGMQAKEELPNQEVDSEEGLVITGLMTKEKAKWMWLAARNEALRWSAGLYDDGEGLHKQIANRITEPWMWITVIVTATEWDNWWNLRCHDDAQPEIREIAEKMLYLHSSKEPNLLKEGEWHLPLWGFEGDKEYSIEEGKYITIHDRNIFLPYPVLISVGRCARVSYLTHDGKRDPEEDIELAVDRLIHPQEPDEPGHWSPWEHVATPFSGNRWQIIKEMQSAIASRFLFSAMIGRKSEQAVREMKEMQRNLEFSGNFKGWTQARKYFPHESGVNE